MRQIKKKNRSLQRKSFLLGDVSWNSYFRGVWFSRAIQLSRESVLTLLCSVVPSLSRILCGLWAQTRIPRAPRTRPGTRSVLNQFCSTFASLSCGGDRPAILSSTEPRRSSRHSCTRSDRHLFFHKVSEPSALFSALLLLLLLTNPISVSLFLFH